MRTWATRALSIAGLAGGILAGTGDAYAEGIPGRIVKVTLYRGQALVTRDVPVDTPAGPAEIVVSPLPEQVVPDSLFAEGAAGLEVRAVRFRARAVGEEPREELRKLEQEQEALKAKLDRNQKMAEVLAQRQAYMEKLETFVAPTATAELSKGVLNAETLQKLAVFSFDQRKALAEESLKLAAEQADLKKQGEFLQRRRAELAAGGKTLHEAVLFLEKRGAGAGTVKLNYLVQNSGWSPAYNFHTLSDAKEIRVEYNALIHQQTGEDWTGVALTLSTAFPSLAADAPGLAPFRVALSAPKGAALPSVEMQSQQASGLILDNASKLRSAHSQFGQRFDRGRNLAYNWEMNAAAGNLQFVELVNPNEILQRIHQEGAAQHEGLSVSYDIAGAVGLASRPDQQLVRIFETKLPAKFFFVAMPLLTRYVYRQAEVTHTGAEALLGGPCSVYLDGRFVGRGESFVVGFGAEGQLRARRDLADKKESVQGGNRELDFKYRLTLENFKDAPITVRVLDRLPVSENETDIRVTLGEMKDKLSEDPLYLRIERPKGILRWDIEAPGKAAGEKARILEFGYRLEFDRKLSLTTPTRAKEMQDEFFEMQERRVLPSAPPKH
jgi:uncharacterized protein (TIGR02231 family)